MPSDGNDGRTRIGGQDGEQAVPGTRGYAEAAERFLEVSEAIDFETLHACLEDFLPPPPARILDIGAGSGRDAAALAERGHWVVAVEPAAPFLEAARELHPTPTIRWSRDSLPRLGSLDEELGSFDFVLCHAVWQHLSELERRHSLERIAALLRPGGHCALALRHGPPGVGSHYFETDTDRTLAEAEAHGLRPVLHLAHQPSAIAGKTAVTWTRLVFEKVSP